MKDNKELELEPFFYDNGVLLVRCKDTKRVIKGVVYTSVENEVDTLPVQIIKIQINNIVDW